MYVEKNKKYNLPILNGRVNTLKVNDMVEFYVSHKKKKEKKMKKQALHIPSIIETTISIESDSEATNNDSKNLTTYERYLTNLEPLKTSPSNKKSRFSNQFIQKNFSMDKEIITIYSSPPENESKMLLTTLNNSTLLKTTTTAGSNNSTKIQNFGNILKNYKISHTSEDSIKIMKGINYLSNIKDEYYLKKQKSIQKQNKKFCPRHVFNFVKYDGLHEKLNLSQPPSFEPRNNLSEKIKIKDDSKNINIKYHYNFFDDSTQPLLKEEILIN